jgi:hypothetical protein
LQPWNLEFRVKRTPARDCAIYAVPESNRARGLTDRFPTATAPSEWGSRTLSNVDALAEHMASETTLPDFSKARASARN